MDILACRKLKTINLDHNLIASIPKEITQLNKLENLILSRNLLDSITINIILDLNLRMLDISGEEQRFPINKKFLKMNSLQEFSCNVSSKELKSVILKMD